MSELVDYYRQRVKEYEDVYYLPPLLGEVGGFGKPYQKKLERD